jgi:hypothetical protein
MKYKVNYTTYWWNAFLVNVITILHKRQSIIYNVFNIWKEENMTYKLHYFILQTCMDVEHLMFLLATFDIEVLQFFSYAILLIMFDQMLES